MGLCVSILYLACIHSGLTALSLETKQLLGWCWDWGPPGTWVLQGLAKESWLNTW